MDREEKYRHWEEIAQYDLDTAKAMLQSGRYLYVAFMCQQAISSIVNQEKASEVLLKSEEVFQWLQSLIQYKK